MTLGEVNKIKAKEREKFLKALDGLRMKEVKERKEPLNLDSEIAEIALANANWGYNKAVRELNNNIDTIKKTYEKR